MNGAIAKIINDNYLVRCAQILNNKSRVTKYENKEDKKEVIIVKAEGIRLSDGSLKEIEDGFNTVMLYKRGSVLTINLWGTNYSIQMYKKETENGNLYYLRNKKLGIKYKQAVDYLDEEFKTEKSFFEFRTPQSIVNTVYAVYNLDLFEPIYYYEEIYGNASDVHTINVAVNNELSKVGNEKLIEILKKSYDDKDELSSEDAEKIEKVTLEFYKNHIDELDLDHVPEDIKNKLGIQSKKESNVNTKEHSNETKTELAKEIENGLEKNEELSSNEEHYKLDYGKYLNSTIYASTFEIEQNEDFKSLNSDIIEAYKEMYAEIFETEGVDFFVKFDMFENAVDIQDSEMTDYYTEMDFDDMVTPSEELEMMVEAMEQSSNEENNKADEDISEMEGQNKSIKKRRVTKSEKEYIDKFSIFSNDGCKDEIEPKDIDDEAKVESLQIIKNNIISKDIEFTDFRSVIEAIIGVHEELQEEIDVKQNEHDETAGINSNNVATSESTKLKEQRDEGSDFVGR